MINEDLALAPGVEVDRFTVERVIAFSASAITYRAADTLTGSRFLLREFVPPGCVTRGEDGFFAATDEQATNDMSTGIARFLAEGARAATLHHPGIATISRWFKANGTAYMVMPWVAGRSLAEMIHAGQVFDPSELLAIALPLLDALEYLHSQEVYQHELGPDTIHLPESGGALLLAGAAFTSRQNDLPGEPHTGGNEAYTPIEQFRPNRTIGPWTDIYALAATLYHCATGSAPPTAKQRWAAVQAHEPDPLSPVGVAVEASTAQREIAALIARGLALEPSARPQSVREWRARISRLPTAKDAVKSRSAVPNTTEGRDWLPIILVGAVLIGIAAVGIYLFSGQFSSTGVNDNSGSGPVLGTDWTSPEEVERWRQALQVDAVVGYRTFMKDFPKSVHTQQAQEHIDRLEDKAWPLVVAEGTRAAYESHLEIFPQGMHATEALAKIEEFNQEEARIAREQDEKLQQDDTAWEQAQAAGSLAALDGYIATWPGGSHIAVARDLRQKMQTDINDSASFGIAAEQNTIAAYHSYMTDFPGGRHVAAAQTAIESLTLRPGKTFKDCADCPLMAVIPAGAFWQGSADASSLAISIEKPRHRVSIAEPFAVSVHEITMRLWDACVADGGCDTHPDDNGWGRENQPVIMVSWNDAMQYAVWLSSKSGQSYTLPSESEWEYFARAGEESDWLGGDAAGICRYGNIAGNETSFDWRHTDCEDGAALATAAAGSYQANAFGLYDVIGNVAEWTLDCMNLSYLEAPADGAAWSRGMCSSRITRGGSWFTGTKESRLAARFNLKNGDRNDFTGFRVVRRVEKQ